MSIVNESTVIDNLEVSYVRKNGENIAVTVVFIHGFPFGKEIWMPQLEVLPDGVGGIAYDIRGFGSSSSGHGFFSIDLFAADLLRLVDHLRLDTVVLCGISMGGYIALRAIERQPERFSGLVLCDTNATADPNNSKLHRFAAIEQVQNEGKEAFAEQFLKKIFSRETVQNNSPVIDFINAMILSLSDTTICASELALASRTDTSGVLEMINFPSMIIRGEEDQLMSREQAQQLQSQIQEADYVEIPGSGHLPNLENPGEFSKCLNGFLNLSF